MDFFTQSDEEIYALAKPIIEDMKKGINGKDYKLFSRRFSAQMLTSVTEEKFNSQAEKNIPEYGELSDQSILGYIRGNSGVTVVYRQHTTKKKGELLGLLLLDDENGTIKVLNAGLY